MKEHPIIFSTDMVKAILDGRKTQTRRVIKKPMALPDKPIHELLDTAREIMASWCPYGQVGDRLWIKETWGVSPLGNLYYKADKEIAPCKWKSPYFIYRHFSRINLEITGIRVERVQDINRKDINNEGTPHNILGKLSYRNDGYQRLEDFRFLWNSINAKRGYSWETNPWVWVIEFRRIK